MDVLWRVYAVLLSKHNTRWVLKEAAKLFISATGAGVIGAG